MILAYLTIRSNNSGTEPAEWSSLIKGIDEGVASTATEVHGRWLSDPADPWQSACWALEFKSERREVNAVKEAVSLRARCRQPAPTITWAVTNPVVL